MWCAVMCFCAFIRPISPEFVYDTKTVSAYEIAGIFKKTNIMQINAFTECMVHSSNEAVKVDPKTIISTRPDSYSMWRELCDNKDIRPIAVIGPQDSVSDGAVRDQCSIANIPHIQVTWQPLDIDTEEDEETEAEGEETNQEEEDDDEEEEIDEEPPEEYEAEEDEQPNEEKLMYKDISINFYPDPDEINIAFAKLLKLYNWEGFAALYEDDFGLLRIQKILAIYTDKFPITVRRLNPEGDNSKIFKQLHASDNRILLDCHADRIMKYLDEAESQDMTGHYQHYIFTSLDTSTVSKDVVNKECNNTWMSLTEYDRPDLNSRVSKWMDPEIEINHQLTVDDFPLEVTLLDDVSIHLLHALTALKEYLEPYTNDTDAIETPICGDKTIPWKHGAKFQDLILTTKTEGFSGNIIFNDKGKRMNYTLHIFEKPINGDLQVIGKWESNSLAIIDARSGLQTQAKSSAKKVFRVMSSGSLPYFSCIRQDCTANEAGQKYEGFVVDLVDEIFQYFKKEKFDYTYVFVDDISQPQGKFDEKEKKWNGMIGALLDKKIDLAVCDFTITEERKKVIDFSVPFMSLGISILYVKEKKATPDWFSFLNPYTVDVWLYAMTAYCVVSVILYICARISPADWENPEPCDKDPEELENTWSFKNCAWLTMGSIMTQGCDILPKAIGTRWICAMWWFFAVIFCQTYIAQLSASMTSALTVEPINSVEDLAKQTKVRYGAYELGSTLNFFKRSEDKMYKKMYQTMMANKAVLVGSNAEGEQRVVRGAGKYAFFMESSTIDYRLKRNCELKKIGQELDSKDYGIAMPANSPFRSDINRAILSLKESTRLEEIKKKWWDEMNAENCVEEDDTNDIEGDLEMDNLKGLFIVLVVGLLLSLVVTAAEFFNEIRNIVIREKLTHKEAIIQELKTSLNLLQLEKPILKNPSRAPSVESSKSLDKKEKMSAVFENFMTFEKENQ